MGVPLKNPPVYFTLAQVRFNQILTLPDYLPKIQERFRHEGFPDFERINFVSIQVKMQDGQANPTPISQERFQLSNLNRTNSFILDNQSLTLQSTDYGHFDDFSSRFLVGLTIINDAIKLAYTERVGLRYLDRIMPEKKEMIEHYLVDQIHGLTSRLGGTPHYSYMEALNEIDNIKLVSRVAIQDGSLAFPPDLQLGNMLVAERFSAYTGRNAILDNDGFIEERALFSTETIANQLEKIHTVIGAAFKAAVTTHAFDMWNM